LTREIVIHPHRLALERPLVSFTFDDAPESAAEAGARLESVGGRGTFYVAGGLCGEIENGKRVLAAEAVRDLAARGHEIGCHTFSHACARTLGPSGLAAETARNAAFFATLGLPAPTSFAYPFGAVSLSGKRALMRRFAACRGTRNGVNAGIVDLGDLRVVDLFGDRLDAERVDAALQVARARRGWVIFYTHDVEPDPGEWGCTPAVFDAALERVVQAEIEIATVGAALARTGAARA